ncbi:glycoside hydrolase family 71 protein [Rhodotorula graminis WP1]|uniref:Glycoside hydrolase family 71 protein n=1 Tax=Rhodotorula graminis (strain WP1) TaxID=578459 RepID=A0A194S5W5_RHOGW|nr:glycoside hydrolase family 71 protein [Rhodotorula graminis WP1]KPV75895.1 glycoside hydrolase family 71 protein [Rhodotorula graminis WP1]
MLGSLLHLLPLVWVAVQHAHAKSVIGHWMGGETQRYTVDDYAADMRLSKAVLIDAWAVNSGKDTYEEEHLDLIFEAAQKEGYKITLSVDMLHWNVKGSSDLLIERLKRYAGKDEWLRIDGKPALTTFSGNQQGTFMDGVSTFKESNDLWNKVLDAAAEAVGSEFYFAPTWLSNTPLSDPDSADLKMSGIANWFGHGEVGSRNNVTAEADASWAEKAAERGLDYWAPVGASFQVHQNDPETNYCYISGHFLLPTRYRSLIDLSSSSSSSSSSSPSSSSSSPSFLYFITLSDWGESTYVLPVRENADPPKGTVDTAVYVRPSDHFPFALMSAYWNYENKNGSPPTITSPAIFWFHRITPAASTPTNDPLPKSKSCDGLYDNLYAVVFIPEGSTASSFVFTTGGKALDAQNVQPGVNLLMAPFGVGDTAVSLQDADGKVLLSGDGARIVESTEIWDANYRAFAIPSDVMPSDFLDLGGSSSSSSGPSKASSTTDVATTKVAATKAASTSAQATAHGPGTSTSSATNDDEASTSAAASSSSTLVLVVSIITLVRLVVADIIVIVRRPE